MFDKEAEVRPQTTEASAAISEQNLEGDNTPVSPRAIRYMDDATFRECLEEVVTTHSRLLSKLAE